MRNASKMSGICDSQLTSTPEHQKRWNYERRTLSGSLQGHRAKGN